MSDIQMVLAMAVIALVLMGLEIFTPSFGMLTLCAVLAAGTAAFFAFKIGMLAGWVFILCILAFIPVYLFVLVKIMPKTPIGKKLMLQKGRDATNEATPESAELAGLVGMEGTAESILRPVGVVRINDNRYDARSEQGVIEKGAKVKVIASGGTDVVVRKI